MNRSDRELMQELLDTLTRYKAWVPAETYSSRINPLVERLRERLSVLDLRDFFRSRSADQSDSMSMDTIPQKIIDIIKNEDKKKSGDGN